MNAYDSARMADVLAPDGYAVVAGPEGADLVILNTCHIREKAAEKIYSELGRLAPLKTARAQGGGHMIIAVAGCVAQAEGAEIVRRAPYVDIVLGPQTYHRLGEMVTRARRAAPGDAPVVDTEFPAQSKFDHLPEAALPQGATAYLSVQEGCDKFCTFCVVPYTRGAEYSRPAADVKAEARRLVAGGAREIMLLGQNVNAYHGVYHGAVRGTGEIGLGGLIRDLAAIEGIERIRYTTSHPLDVDDELIAAHGEVAELMPYLHLPVQSGSDRVLAAMNRRYGRDDYRRVADKLRQARGDMALASDFIVGFPGETDADFAATLSLVAEIGFAQAYSFKFSPRPGTPAAAMTGQVPEDVKTERLAHLQQLLDHQQRAFNQRWVGTTMAVLFDRQGKRPHQLAGRSPYMQAVILDAATADAAEAAETPDAAEAAETPDAAEAAETPDAAEAAETSVSGTVAQVLILEAHANSLKAALAPRPRGAGVNSGAAEGAWA